MIVFDVDYGAKQWHLKWMWQDLVCIFISKMRWYKFPVVHGGFQSILLQHSSDVPHTVFYDVCWMFFYMVLILSKIMLSYQFSYHSLKKIPTISISLCFPFPLYFLNHLYLEGLVIFKFPHKTQLRCPCVSA